MKEVLSKVTDSWAWYFIWFAIGFTILTQLPG